MLSFLIYLKCVCGWVSIGHTCRGQRALQLTSHDKGTINILYRIYLAPLLLLLHESDFC